MEKYYAPHIYNVHKMPNILKLADRVEVIREYDKYWKRPSIKSLAKKFDCSTKQIRNILINRNSILESCGSNAGPPKQIYSGTEALQKRQENIDFLGKVMYEYLQRMLYFNQNIDCHKFRLKALQIKECIGLENFQPTDDWIEDFKMTYNIQDLDSQSLRNNIAMTEAKRPLLSAIDMIRYVNRKMMEESTPKAEINGDDCLDSPIEPKIVYEIENEGEEFQKFSSNDSPAKVSAHGSFSSNTNKYTVKQRATLPFPDIESVDEALKHVEVLKEYAMLHDNFRAVGLLTQLEQIFKQPDKLE